MIVSTCGIVVGGKRAHDSFPDVGSADPTCRREERTTLGGAAVHIPDGPHYRKRPNARYGLAKSLGPHSVGAQSV